MDTSLATRVLPAVRIVPGDDIAGARLTNADLTDRMRDLRDRIRAQDPNDDVPVSDEDFPEQRLGILERRVLDASLSARDMAVAAGRRLLADTAIDPHRIALVVVTTVTPDRVVPALATTVQSELGLPHDVLALDVTVGCSSFVLGLETVRRHLLAAPDPEACALLIGAEAMTRVVDASDRATCTVFGDGAAAVLVDRTTAERLAPATVHTDGSSGPLIEIRQPRDGERRETYRFVARDGTVRIARDEDTRLRVSMQGRRVFKDMLRGVPAIIASFLDRHGLTPDDIDLAVFHQANRKMIEGIVRDPRLNLPLERVPFDIEHLGNTTSASIPILLSELQDAGRLAPGTRALLVGFGTGYSVGVTAVTFG